MVVLAASVCTKSGTAIVSRQFVDIGRPRIEGLLASFPKLVGSAQQHTYVETESVRFVYQPLEDHLYLVLVTTRSSNILQDIETLHLFARVVPETCRGLDEAEIRRNAFEIIFAFDEIISLGYRESLNLQQLRTVLEAESHDEKLQEMIARNKEQEARENAKLKEKQIEMQKREAAKRAAMGLGGAGGFGNRSTGSYSGPNTNNGPSSYSQSQPRAPAAGRDSVGSPTSFAPEPARPSGKGMKLGGKKTDFFDAVKTETGFSETPSQHHQQQQNQNQYGTPASSNQANTIVSPTRSAHVEPVVVTIEEKIVLVMDHDGGVKQCEIKGDLVLSVNIPEAAGIRLHVRSGDNKQLQFRTHPNVDKQAFASGIIAPKEGTRNFPVQQPLGVLKWRFTSTDESAVPLSIQCWPSPAGDGIDVHIEYELLKTHLTLNNVLVSVPLPINSPPNVSECDGQFRHNRNQQTLEWMLPVIDGSSTTGSIAFKVAGQDVTALYPLSVTWQSETTYCGVDVLEVRQAADGSPVPFAKELFFVPEDYRVL